VGDRVSHKVFGEGLVLATSGDGDRLSVLVSFSSDKSQRKLMTRYANLTRIGKPGEEKDK
jgi:PcrA/UvrD tudor domain